ARRDPTPAAARTFCKRSSFSSLGIGDLFHVAGEEGSQRWQLVHRVQPQLLQKQRGRAVQVSTGLRLRAALLNQTAGHQSTYHAVTVDPADRGDLGTGHRLLV